MSRFKTYGQTDEAPLQDGDGGFLGVNQYSQPHQLEPGYVADARNCRFVAGRIEPRLGVAKLPWPNGPASSDVPQPMGTIYGAGVYRDGDDIEWAIIAADGVVYRTREGAGLVEVPLPPGIVLDYDVSFTQTFNGLVMFRGTSYPELYMTDLDEGFKSVVQETNTVTAGTGSENPADGTEEIPPAANGEWIGNRLFVPYEDTATGQRDMVAVSDYLNATRYAPIRAAGRINQGSSDRLLRISKFNEFSAVAFKEKSVYALYNIKGDLTDMVLDEISSEVGLAAPYAVVQAGRNVDQAPSMLWFLSARRGISSLVFGEYGKLQLMAEPVSKAIQKLIDRIDWRNASKARAAWWNNRVYFAVPLDSSKAYQSITLPESTYPGDGSSTVPVIPGATYRWTPGSSGYDLGCTNGATTYTDKSEFVAAASSIELLGIGGAPPATPIQATLERVYTETCNAVLVYDFLTQAWAGYDDGPAMLVKEFLTITFNGEARLFYVSTDGYINLVEELPYDEVAIGMPGSWPALGLALLSYDTSGRCEVAVTRGKTYVYSLGANDTGIENGTQTLTATYGSFVARGTRITLLGTASQAVTTQASEISYDIDQDWIEEEWLSRGYTAGEMAWKEFQGGAMHLATWNPSYSIWAVMDGASEEFLIIDTRTKDPTEYYRPFNAEPWDRTNTNDDHDTAYREDYSVILDEAAISTGLTAGTVYFVENLGGSGGVVYNSIYRVPPSTFTGVAGQTTISVLETSLVAQWKFEEASGNRVDAKNASNLVPTGTPGRVTGKIGYAAAMTLDTEQLQVASNAYLQMGDIDFTIAGWWKFTELDGPISEFARQMCGKGWQGSCPTNEYNIGASSTPQSIKFEVNFGANVGVVDSGVVPVAGTWYFVAAWHDSVANKIWIQINNGTAVSANHSAGVPVGTNPFYVGCADNAQPFNGQVDALMIWKRVLSAGERTALYNSGNGLEPGLGGTPYVYPPGGYVFMGDTGIDFDLEQECVQPLELDGRCRGRYLQMRFLNDQGRAAVVGTEVEAIRTQRRLATKA